MHRLLKFVVILIPIFVLSGCFGNDNVLIGKWQIDAELLKQQAVGPMQYNMTVQQPPMEFTKTSLVQGGQEMTVSYKIEKNKIGVVANMFGAEETNWFTIIDKNTISEQGFRGIVKTYRRIQ